MIYVRDNELASFPPFPFKKQAATRIRWRGIRQVCEDDFVLDTAITSESFYDIVVDNPYAFTLVRMRIVNLSDALQTNCYLFWGGEGEGGTAVEFTSADFGGAPDPNSYPTTNFGSPASGSFDLFCNQPVPALGYLQLNVGDFVDSGVGFSSLLAEFHYTYNCADRT